MLIKTTPKRRALGLRPPIFPKHAPQLSALKCMQKAPPPQIIRTVDPGAKMYDNDSIGDCTCAGLANYISAWMALNKMKIDISTQEVVNFYSLVSGYTPTNPNSDTGAVISSVLTKAMSTGFTAMGNKYFPLWGSAGVGSMTSVANIISQFGAAYIGVALAQADEQTTGTWSLTNSGDQTPWSWGGHCLLVWDYEGLGPNDIVRLITWGGFQECTVSWLQNRMVETHALAFRQLLPASGVNFLGDDWDTFISDNNAYLRGSVIA